MSEEQSVTPETSPMIKETKRERFLRLANLRTNAALEKIRILGGCSNRFVYEFSESEVTTIFNALRKAVDETEALFKKEEPTPFTLIPAA